MSITTPGGLIAVHAGALFTYDVTLTDADTWAAADGSNQHVVKDAAIECRQTQQASMQSNTNFHFTMNGQNDLGVEKWTITGNAVTVAAIYVDTFIGIDGETDQTLIDPQVSASQQVNVTVP